MTDQTGQMPRLIYIDVRLCHIVGFPMELLILEQTLSDYQQSDLHVHFLKTLNHFNMVLTNL